MRSALLLLLLPCPLFFVALGCAEGDGDGGGFAGSTIPEAWDASLTLGDAVYAGGEGGGGNEASEASAAHVDGGGPFNESGSESASNEAAVDSAGADAHDATILDTGIDTGAPDVVSEASSVDACGICDQIWVCNGFADMWVSSGPQACVDVSNGTELYCVQGDTIDYPDPNNNDGTWSVTPTGLALYFNSLDGTVEIDCVPGQ